MRVHHILKSIFFSTGTAGGLARVTALVLLSGYALCAPEHSMQPVRVCEVLQDLPAYNGKTVAVIGRYSFRPTGYFLSEQICDRKLTTGAFVWPNVLRVSFDGKAAPKPPVPLEVDGGTIYRKLHAIERHTALAHIRFGTPDYDRWAVVYGRVETKKEFLAPTPPAHADPAKFDPAPARLVTASADVVIFVDAHPDDQ
ncbi:MAG: hypothetical protein ABI165_15330 [Bryobacteraceae bacterium]